MSLKKSDIENAYVSLMLRFKAAVQSASLKVNYRDPIGVDVQLKDNKEIFVNSLLWMPNWKYRSAATGKQIGILIRSVEKYSGSAGEMVKSTVQVTYLEPNGKEWNILIALHYDFESPPQAQHPIFHLQLGESTFTQDELQRVGIRTVLNRPKAVHYGGIRIPTAHMSLSAVLVGIAADHLKVTEYGNFLADLRKNQLIKWAVSCNPIPINHRTHSGNLFHCHHWY
jgi:hypothetical protein